MSLKSKIVLVTGASSGIGQSIAFAFAKEGASLYILGRNVERLETVREQCLELGAKNVAYTSLDLGNQNDIQAFANTLDHIDVLVNSAGLYANSTMQNASVTEFTTLQQVNVLGPYTLTQALLPLLKKQQGDIVFINSSITQRATPTTGQFAATQHALKGLTDSLREEVNEFGLRVLSIFPGRTATPRQARIFKKEQRDYTPEKLLQADNVAAVIVHSLSLPRSAEVTDIYIRPNLKN